MNTADVTLNSLVLKLDAQGQVIDRMVSVISALHGIAIKSLESSKLNEANIETIKANIALLTQKITGVEVSVTKTSTEMENMSKKKAGVVTGEKTETVLNFLKKNYSNPATKESVITHFNLNRALITEIEQNPLFKNETDQVKKDKLVVDNVYKHQFNTDVLKAEAKDMLKKWKAKYPSSDAKKTEVNSAFSVTTPPDAATSNIPAPSTTPSTSSPSPTDLTDMLNGIINKTA
jgi:hypothetical protein